jgi:hypothetical protein
MTGSSPLSLNRAATLSLTANVLSARRASAISTLETNGRQHPLYQCAIPDSKVKRDLRGPVLVDVVDNPLTFEILRKDSDEEGIRLMAVVDIGILREACPEESEKCYGVEGSTESGRFTVTMWMRR